VKDALTCIYHRKKDCGAKPDVHIFHHPSSAHFFRPTDRCTPIFYPRIFNFFDRRTTVFSTAGRHFFDHRDNPRHEFSDHRNPAKLDLRTTVFSTSGRPPDHVFFDLRTTFFRPPDDLRDTPPDHGIPEYSSRGPVIPGISRNIPEYAPTPRFVHQGLPGKPTGY